MSDLSAPNPEASHPNVDIRPPADEEARNRMLCDAAESGDAARLRALIQLGLNPNGYWNAESAREGHRRFMESMAEDREVEELGNKMPEELRESFAATRERLDREMFERLSSAPSEYEIPLFCAAKLPNAECLSILLDAGADPRVRDCSKRTAMYIAHSLEVVQRLVAAGVPLEDADEYGWSPLAAAVGNEEDALPAVRALIQSGANANATHDRGYTIFMHAVGSGRRLEVLKLLVASGADPHAISELGWNAFHAAIDVNGEANAECSVRETLGYLRELGVNIEQRTKGGQTPLARALEVGTGIEAQVLCELGANSNITCPKHECGKDACERVDLPLLFHAVDGTGVAKDVKTAVLLKAGADPLVTDPEGFRPIHAAVARLCADAEDYEAAYTAFFEGIKGLRLQVQPTPTTRDEFVQAAKSVLDTYIEQFAASIPIDTTYEYASKWRTENTACVAWLCAYEWWARLERRSHSQSE